MAFCHLGFVIIWNYEFFMKRRGDSMKKRSLFKRLFSGIVATALAATICFGDRAFSDLFASAEGETQTVNVNFVDNGEAKPYDSHENGMRYFVLGALVDKDAGPKIAATADYEDQIVAWDCKEITPNTDAQSTVSFDEFYENDNDHTKFDRDQKKIKFDADKYKFITRVYRYWVNKTQYGGTSPSENPHSTKGVEPTNLIAPEKGGFWYSEPYQQPAYYVEQSSDTFPNYIPSNSKEGNTTTVEFDKHHNEFGIVVNFSKSTTIKADEYYYIVVEVEHQNHDKTYFYTNLTANNANSVEYTVQKGDVRKWMTAGGVINPNEQYHGNELSTKVRLFKASSPRELTPLLNGDGCTEIKTGDFAKTQKVDIKELTVDERDAVNTKYYETINFLKADESDKYTYKEILGSGIAFGLTADRFALNNHAQTNYAVNYFRDLKNTTEQLENGQNSEPDLAGPASETYIAYFANLTDPTDLTPDTSRGITIGDPQSPHTVHLEDINRVNLLKDEQVTLDGSMKGAQIKADVVDPIIAQMQSMSNRLASKPANITPVRADSRIMIDTLDYDDDATIYVDGDALAENGEFKTNDVFKFIKKENQTIVINFKETKKVSIDMFEIRVFDEKGNIIKESSDDSNDKVWDSSPDGARGSDKNNYLNKHVMRRIVWNFAGAENTDDEFKADEACITIRNTAGLFLIPNAKTVTKVPSTSTGWLISAGYVENNGGEWHFPYDELTPFEKPKTMEIGVSKKAVTGDAELPGATLELYDKVKGKNIGDAIWRGIFDTAKTDNPDVADSMKRMLMERNVCYGITWKSGDSPVNLKLRDGVYVLKEFGYNFMSGGQEYYTIRSEYEFEITNGAVTKVSKDVKDNNGSSIAYDSTNNTIVIRDAQVGGPKTYPVHINKTDVTGQKELAGATLTVYKKGADGQLEKVNDVNNPWRSEDGKELTLALEDGNYVLKETGTTVTDADNNTYKVLETAVEFTISNGVVTNSSANVKDDFAKVDKKDGGAVAQVNKSGEAVITVCDAINTTTVTLNKTDITGEKELAGAVLTIKQGNTVVKEWTSKPGEKMTVTLDDGTYTLTEEAAKDTSGKPINVVDANGKTYDIVKSVVEFTVRNGAVVSSTNTVSSVDNVDQTTGGVVLSGTEFTVCDAANKTPVTLNKTDITGDKELDGAILTIKQGNDVIATWESKKGETKTVSLEDGTYTLTETGTNVTDGTNNYKVHNTALEFTVTNGTVTADKAKTEFDSNATEGYFVAKGADLTVCDVVIPKHEIVISKTDISGQKEIDGAVLTIKDSNKNIVAGPWTSKADGKGGNVLTVTLEDGNYTLTETGDTVTDADGNTYKILTSEIKFTVADGKVTSTSAGVVDDIKKVDAANGGVVANGTANLTICDAVRTVKVTISKTDVTGQAEVKGAKLILKDSTDTQVGDTWVSGGENGSKWEVSLAPGKYTLTEAPDSVVTDENNKQYQVITSTYEFEVGTDGKVKQSKAIDTTEGTISAEGNVITVVDAIAPAKTTPVHINKTDITGQKELAGATLTVYKKGADNQLTKVEDAYNPWVSTADAQLTLALTDGNYVLKETGTTVTDADGKTYKILTTDVEFTVTNGTVSSRTAKTSFADMTTEGAVLTKDAQSGEYTLTICDAVKTVKVTISKTDVTGQKEVKGAKLIVKDNSDTQVGETWVSGGENGSKFEISLAPGKYTLTEAPDSTVTDDDGNEYQVITTVYEFEVGTDGKVKESKKVETNEGSITAGEGNVITVVDAIAPAKTTYVHINKTDITGQKELTGATLTVYSVGADNQLTKVEDANNPWQSAANAQLTLALEDGTYELKETGTTVTDADGKTYTVLTTGVRFTVSNGTVSSSTAKTSFADMTTEGAVLTKDAQSGEYTLTICDAANKTPVTLNKTDITGQKELAGAKLTIKQGETTVAEWVSVIGQTKTVELEDGTYTLEETGTKITDNDGNLYDVMPSIVTFTVSGGTVTSTDAKASFNDVGENGGAVLNEKTLTICDAKTVIPKYPVKINKTDVTGEKELTGATLTVKQGDKVIDSWTSKPGETMELELEDGDYTLTESGDEVKDANGKTYKILGSTIGFTVTNGTVTSRGAKTTFDDVDKTAGGVVVKNNVITVCDAANVTKVIINKTDVTGEKELTGAIITVKQGETVIKEWTSKPNETMELELEDGDYTLTESGDEVKDADGKTYKVIGSEVKFTVQNGTVTSTGAKTTFDDVDKTTGGVVVTGTHITISDAANVTPVVLNKTDITGDKELAGATLTIKQGTKTVASWVSVIGETKTVELEDGDYSLTESGDEVKDANGKTYKVLTTVLDFTVKNGTVSSTAAKTAFNKDATGGYVVLQNNKLTVCDVMELTKVKLNKTDITGDNELAGATLTIKQGTKTVASWVSVIGDTYEVELEDGEYTLTESGTTVTDAQGVKYDVMTSTVTFTVSGGKVTSQTVRTDFDATAQTGYVVLKNKTELTVCDVKKTQGNVSSSGSQQSNPSMSVSSPQVSSQPSGNVSSGQSQPSVPSQSVSIPSQSVSVPSQSNSTPVSTVKPNTPSDSNSSSISQNSSSKTSESSKGNGTTTKKSSNGQPPVTTTTGNGGNPPQTGHSGSTVTVAALLAAVAALAVLKKKNDD